MGDTLNGLPNPYVDKNLRKALQLSVDRKALLRYLRNGLGVPGGQGFVPPALVLAASPEEKKVMEASDLMVEKNAFQLDSARYF